MGAAATSGPLHAEWLKLKGCLFDPITRLPTLPAVVDNVRVRLERGETLGLLYVDLSSDGRYEAIYGWQVYDHMLRLVAQRLQASRGDLYGLDDELAQVSIRAGEFVLFLGLDEPAKERLESIYQTVSEDLRRSLEVARELSGQPMPPLLTAAVAIDSVPTIRPERSIYQCLQEARMHCRAQSQKRQTGRLADLLRLLEKRNLVIRYQPILDLTDGHIHGFEALSAPPSDTSFSSPEMLFSYAEETDRIVELERLCRREAVMRSGRWTPRVASRLEAENPKLFLNCSAPAFTDPELCETLIALTGAVGYRPDDIVLEVTERVAITEWQAFQTALARVRRAGLKVAIDDMGSGYSSLHAVAEIEPDYLKFDLSLILNIHRSRIKRNLLESLVLLADKISARTIAEGLECEDEFETVRRMGIEYGQGYLFARPAPPSALDEVHFPRQVA